MMMMMMMLRQQQSTRHRHRQQRRPNTELYAAHLFKAYSFVGRFCGFPKDELKALAIQAYHGEHQVSRLEDRKFLLSSMIGGIDVLFPTEDFLVNQQIKKKES